MDHVVGAIRACDAQVEDRDLRLLDRAVAPVDPGRPGAPGIGHADNLRARRRRPMMGRGRARGIPWTPTAESFANPGWVPITFNACRSRFLASQERDRRYEYLLLERGGRPRA